MFKYLCGTPDNKCRGSLTQLASCQGHTKSHSSTDEAFRCYAAYLIGEGYTQVGSREFAAPNGGPVLVLTKKSRFGARLRKGKNVEGKGSRFTTQRTGGTII